jgi:fucose 4-O-acetylase-like acetyltransferase
MKNKSNRYLACLSGIGIILVVIGHSEGTTPEQVIRIASENYLYLIFTKIVDWIYTFHMPLFFFISGYWFEYTNKNKNYEYIHIIKAKAIRLLIPYIFLSSIAFPVKAFLSAYADRIVTFSIQDFIFQIVYPRHNVIMFFWFLPTLFLIFVLALVLLRKKMGIPHMLMILLLSIIMYIEFDSAYANKPFLAFLNIGGALHNFVFFYLGFLLSRFNIEHYLKQFGLIGLPLSILAYWLCSPDSKLCNLLLAIFGISMSWGLCRIIYNQGLSRIGDYSYQIYLFSWFPQSFFRMFLQQVLHINIFYSVFTATITGLFVPIIVTIILNKITHPKIRLLYGG